MDNIFLKQVSFLNLTIGQAFAFLGFNCLLFEDVIQTIAGISWIDELASFLLFICGLFYSVKRSRPTGLASASFVIFGLVLISAIGTSCAAIGQPIVASLIDAYTYVKFPIAFFGSLMLAPSFKRLKPFLLAEAKLLSVLLCLFGCLNLFVDFGMRSVGGRYWANSFQGIWSVPTLLVAMCVGLIALLLNEGLRKNRLFIICNCLSIIFTQRSKGFAVVGILAILLVVVNKKSPRLSVTGILVIALGAIFIGWDAFVLYFGTNGFARSELLQNGFSLAMRYFPLGSGFGTFGSAVSGDYYSPLYYQLGLDQVYGLSPIDHGFLSDSFWPTIAGQSGFLGLLLYVVFLWLTYRKLSRLADSKNMYISLLLPFFYLLISSTSESAFFSPPAVYLALVIGLCATNTCECLLTKNNYLDAR